MRNGQYIKWQHGMDNDFGGKSAFWRGWCPKPTREELDGWPETVKDAIQEYFPKAAKLLNVVLANEISANECKGCGINNHHCVFGELQNVLVEKLESNLPEAVKRVDQASLALRPDMLRRGRVQKNSVADPLLNLLQARSCQTREGSHPLEIKIGCLVEKILHEDGKAVALQTNQGDLSLGDAKLILAMGVLPPTTLMLNSFSPSSFKQLASIGTRYTAHFMSSYVARVPLHAHIDPCNMYHDVRKKTSGNVEVAAIHIPGINLDSKNQFHVQLSALLDKTPVEDTQNTMLHFPDVIPEPSLEQLSSSKDPQHIIFVCKTIGEVDHDNKDNWFRLNNKIISNGVIPNGKIDITCNTTLQVVENEVDHQLWDTMDDSTFAVLERLDSRDDPNDPCQLEYWHDSSKSWRKERPPRDQIRHTDLVHEASTMWIGDSKSSPVGLDYRFKGVKNVYLTGAALWPTAGSWNPTCIVTALAIHLADKLLDNEDNNHNNNNSSNS